MAQKITEKALLQCNQGTIETELHVTSQNFFFIENKAIATEQDKESQTHIKPFGLCKLKPVPGGFLPCKAAPISWQQTTTKDELNGYKVLLDTSVCPCATGGIIKVTDKGHIENHEAD
ncbi:DUF4280 domain-containing protein [Apibacter raozihei]|uniref:DUF4280 domain-containing protein n=1 Tax=Apibacter raozihei TaxID=2500547 RepID=UPI000FE2AE45|nr:DUF4280 domain-containing protein [Apibacter raozihei]